MATDNELTRLAGMTNALRPEWNTRSVRHYLAAHHHDRGFADLAVALAAIATDPTADTPARLDQSGPWWTATRALTTNPTPDVGPGRGVARCEYAGHEHESAARCRLCRAERLAGLEPEPATPYSPAPKAFRPPQSCSDARTA